MPPWRPAIGETLTFIPGAGHETWKKKVMRSFEYPTRYLFRVYDENSLGSTTEIYVSSPLARSGSPTCHRNLLDQPAKEAADNLNRHLRWKSSHHTKTNLVSWTSSLLFAIQFALYKYYHSEERVGDSTSSRVHILMIDTSRFPKGTFIRDLEVLRCLKNRSFPIKQLYRLRTSEDGYSFGEHLSQGCINVTGACGTIRLDQLLQTNFRGPDVCPYFARVEDWSTLAKRVVSIRKLVEESKGEHASLAQARTFLAIAESCLSSSLNCRATLAPAFSAMLLAVSRFSGLEDDAKDLFLRFYPDIVVAVHDDSWMLDDQPFEVKLFHDQSLILKSQYFESKTAEKYKQRTSDHMIGVGKEATMNEKELFALDMYFTARLNCLEDGFMAEYAWYY